MSISLRQIACAQCPRRQPPSDGVSLCSESQLDVQTHIVSGKCPAGRYVFWGPGTELKAIFAEIGFDAGQGCGCEAMAAQMDRWGVQGCIDRKAAIVEQIIERARVKGISLGFLGRVGIQFAVGIAINRARKREASAPIP